MNTHENSPLSPHSPAATDLASAAPFQLGSLLVQPSLLSVSGAGATETLEPRVMQVLVALARHRGQVVSRERLVELCWDGRVVGDDAIQRCMVRLRKLSESRGGFTLETIRRVGYRLVEAPTVLAADNVSAQTAPPAPLRRNFIAPALALLLIAVLAFTSWQLQMARSAGEQNAATLAAIADLVDKDQYGAAFALARPLIQNPATRSDELLALWARIVVPMRPLVEEDGATLWFRTHADLDGPWIEAGTTPFTTAVDAPRGTLQIKVEKEGFHTGYFVVANPGPSVQTDGPLGTTIPEARLPPAKVPLPLRAATSPADLVPVPHTDMPVSVRGWTRLPVGENQQDIPAFAIERTEVTNRQFKEFLDAGGYDNPLFWEGLEFRDENRVLSWQEARARFVDTTGKPGPAGWELGSYANGEATLPVTGVSWYEAQAYARFRNRLLPTLHHWARAAYSPYDPYFNTRPDISLSGHFLSAGPVPADTAAGLGPWGTYHMAGNVFEWVATTAGEQALIMGGSWQGDAASYSSVSTAPPLWRAAHIGLRLMQSDTPVRTELLEPVALWDTNATERVPMSDEVFAGMRLQFTPSGAELSGHTIDVIEETELWTAEEITLSYTDGSSASLLLVRPNAPNAPAAPLQPVVYGPGAACCIARRPNRQALETMASLDFIVLGGRALVMPIWANSYERFVAPLPESGPAPSQDFERELALQFHKDIVRVVDYLQTRADLDADRIGYLGNSLGSVSIAAVVLTMEPRVKAAVLLSGAISSREGMHPMYDMLHFAPRIHVPVLMLNGRFDPAAAYDPAQLQMFRLLGTAPADKAHHVFDAGHIDLPRNSIAREASDWFDRYLGAP